MTTQATLCSRHTYQTERVETSTKWATRPTITLKMLFSKNLTGISTRTKSELLSLSHLLLLLANKLLIHSTPDWLRMLRNTMWVLSLMKHKQVTTGQEKALGWVTNTLSDQITLCLARDLLLLDISQTVQETTSHHRETSENFFSLKLPTKLLRMRICNKKLNLLVLKSALTCQQQHKNVQKSLQSVVSVQIGRLIALMQTLPGKFGANLSHKALQ